MTAPPEIPTSAAAKKGTSPVVWIAFGCAATLFVIVVALVGASYILFNKVKDVAADFQENPAMTAATLLVRANPELELIDRDERGQTLTVRHKETGEQVTVNVADVQRGRLSFETPEGTIDLSAHAGADEVPSWIPIYPDAQVTGAYTARSPEGTAGGLTVVANAPAARILDFYRTRLVQAGFSQTGFAQGSENAGTLLYVSEDERRGISVIVADSNAMINYTDTR